MPTPARRILTAIALAALSLPTASARQAAPKPAKLALVGGMVLDGYGAPRFTTPDPEKIKDIQIVRTVVGGAISYQG
jgi:hypothetical protein